MVSIGIRFQTERQAPERRETGTNHKNAKKGGNKTKKGDAKQKKERGKNTPKPGRRGGK